MMRFDKAQIKKVAGQKLCAHSYSESHEGLMVWKFIIDVAECEHVK